MDLKRKIDDLSYGNKKKVGIVQGLLHQPKLIVLDEPTSGLDTIDAAKVLQLDPRRKPAPAPPFSSPRTSWAKCKKCAAG